MMRFIKVLMLFGLVLVSILVFACEKKEDPLALDVTLSGKVTNLSGSKGAIIVEIDHNLRDIADSEGRWAFKVHEDYYVDSLYSWVDTDGNGAYTSGEPYGFYHSESNPSRAKAFLVRNTDVTNLNITIQ